MPRVHKEVSVGVLDCLPYSVSSEVKIPEINRFITPIPKIVYRLHLYEDDIEQRIVKLCDKCTAAGFSDTLTHKQLELNPDGMNVKVAFDIVIRCNGSSAHKSHKSFKLRIVLDYK